MLEINGFSELSSYPLEFNLFSSIGAHSVESCLIRVYFGS